MAVKQV